MISTNARNSQYGPFESASSAARPLVSKSRLALTVTTVLLAGVTFSSTVPSFAAGRPTATIQTTGLAQAAQPRLRLRIAVDQCKWTEIRGNCAFPSELREGLQAELVQKLQESGGFRVMEREGTALSQGITEDKVAQGKRADLPDGAAPHRQHRTPAQYIITPTVIGFEVTSDHKNTWNIPGIGGVGGGKTVTTLTLNLRISDAQTSEVFASFPAQGEKECKSQNIKITLHGVSNESITSDSALMKDVVDRALSDAVSKITQKLAAAPWYAVVAARDAMTGRVVIAAGSDSGIANGMEFDVNKTGGVVRDEDGDIISRGDEVTIGRIRVVRVEGGAAFADILSGKGFAPGNMVRSTP